MFSYRVDPKQLRAEQLAERLEKEPDLLDLVKPEIAAMLRATLSSASQVEPHDVTPI